VIERESDPSEWVPDLAVILDRKRGDSKTEDELSQLVVVRLMELGLIKRPPRLAVINAGGANTFYQLYERFGLRWSHAPTVLAHPLPDGRCATLHRGAADTAPGGILGIRPTPGVVLRGAAHRLGRSLDALFDRLAQIHQHDDARLGGHAEASNESDPDSNTEIQGRCFPSVQDLGELQIDERRIVLRLPC